MTNNDVAKIIVGDLNPFLAKMGYKYIKSRLVFQKKQEWGEFEVFLSIGKVGWDWVINCVIGIRINQIENITEQFKYGDPDKHSKTHAQGIYFLTNGKVGDYYCKSMDDIKINSKFFASFLEENLNQIEATWRDVKWLERLYNDPVNRELIKHKMITTSRMCGLVLAKLTGRPDFEELAREYDEELYSLLNKHVQVKHVYPGRFNELVKYLRSL